jgi:hypothetical protein
MGKQYNKVEKRQRRVRYLKRKQANRKAAPAGAKPSAEQPVVAS